MKKIIVPILVIGLGSLFWFLFSKSSVNPTAVGRLSTTAGASQKSPSPSAASQGAPVPLPQEMSSLKGTYPRWEGGRSTDLNDPRWKIIHERENNDRAWQGRMPIDFFGKVIDANGLPVEGATAKLIWTDLSPHGSTQSTTKSDVNGLFSLRDARGKNLSVEVTKAGYYTPKQDRYGYEYAAFSDERFYQPDSANPVIYRLRKKQEAEPLIYHEHELKISVGAASEVALDTGVKLQIELLSNSRPKQGPWSMRVNALTGGLQTSVEEFPFLAPSNGYQSNFVLDDNTPKPPTWENPYQGGVFYLRSGSNFGRIEMQMIPGKDWMRIKSWLNPSGSRNLEFDPANAIKR